MYHGDWTDEREERKAEIFPVLLTPAEVMEILGVGKNTIYALLNTGKLQGVRVGRSWRITEHALETFLLLNDLISPSQVD